MSKIQEKELSSSTSVWALSKCNAHPFFPYTYALLLGKKTKDIPKDFMGISSANLHEMHSSTWVSKGNEGLIACAKCNRDSYDNELGFRALFLFCSRTTKSEVWGHLLA